MTKIEDIIEVLEVFRDYKWKGEYTSTEEQREQYNREIKDVKQMKEYIIKETAKEILQVLFDNHFEKVNDYENRRVGYSVHDFYCEIKRLANEYGVEVDE